jgi:hypothetical protein
MSFIIQLFNPVVTSLFIRTEVEFIRTEVEQFEDTIGKIFAEYTECAYFLWNSLPISVSDQYDLRVNIYDVLLLLEAVLNSEQGSHKVS